MIFSKNSEKRIAQAIFLLFLFSGTVLGVQLSDGVNFDFDGFELSASQSLIFGEVSVTQDRILLDGTELYEDSENYHRIDIGRYDESMPRVMDLDYNVLESSQLVWDVSEIAESDDQLSVIDGSGDLIFTEEQDLNPARINLDPREENSEFEFFVSSEEAVAQWEYSDEVEAFRIYRNETQNPSSSIYTTDWATVIELSFENNLGVNQNGNYEFEAIDPGIRVDQVYCYRVTAVSNTGVESEPIPSDPTEECVVIE